MVISDVASLYTWIHNIVTTQVHGVDMYIYIHTYGRFTDTCISYTKPVNIDSV